MPKEKKETVTQELTIIDEPSQAIALYKITPSDIAERLKAYDSLKVIKGDPKSYKEVRVVLTALIHTRTEVEKRRLKLGGDYRGLVEKSISNINEAAEMLANPMAPYEERFKSELKTEDARLDAIKAEKVRLEEERVENIRAEIHKIQELAMPTILGTMPLENLRELSDRLEKMEITGNAYMEHQAEATKVLDDTYDAIQDAITARIQIDKEAAERKVEDARLEKVRKKQEVLQEKLDEQDKKTKKAQKKIDDDKAAIEADKKAAREKVEFDEKMKDLKAQAEKEAKEKLEKDENERKQREREKELEKARQESLKPDRDKIYDYANALMDISTAQVKCHEAKEILAWASNEVKALAEQIKQKVQEL